MRDRVAGKQRGQQASSPSPGSAVRPSTSAHPILQLQLELGNQAVGRWLRTLGGPASPEEGEANRVAAGITARAPGAPVQPISLADGNQPGGQPGGQGRVKAVPGAVPVAMPVGTRPGDGAAELADGRQLPHAVRADLEPRFGVSFAGVRIHTGTAAAVAAKALRARAFTVGRDVVFGSGQFAPGTGAGRFLLAHELTHVLQQGRSGASLEPRCLLEVAGVGPDPSRVELYPAEEGAVRVAPLAHVRGGLETDSSLRPRVSAIVTPGVTLRAIAKRIHPVFVKAAPDSAPSEEDLAKAIAVYSHTYLPVPSMTRFQVGLRLPLPIEIDPAKGDWIVNPVHINLWRTSFDPTWETLKVLDRAPEDLAVAPAATQEAAVDDFLAKNTTPLAQGIALAARLLSNAFASEQFALRVFDRLGDKGFDVAVELMDTIVRHQAELLASLGGGMAVLWRVRTLLSLPPPGLSPEREARRQRGLRMLPAETVLGFTAGNRPVQAFLFPGTSSERALIVAGVHGSEQSGVEVVQLLIDELRKSTVRPFFTTLVVPKLFPDNYEKARREGSTETNRDFPAKGTSLDTAFQKGKGGGPVDELGKKILPENVMLLRLIERWRPSRTASVHATFDLGSAGVFTDPRTVSAGARAAAKAKGEPVDDLAAAATEADRQLAFDMATEAKKRGANVAGNQLAKGEKKFVADFPAEKPVGVSFGGYGPQDVTEGKATDRPSMTVITMEVGGNEPSSKEKDPDKQTARLTELKALRDVLLFLFLRAPNP